MFCFSRAKNVSTDLKKVLSWKTRQVYFIYVCTKVTETVREEVEKTNKHENSCLTSTENSVGSILSFSQICRCYDVRPECLNKSDLQRLFHFLISLIPAALSLLEGDELFVVTFSALTRWAGNFEKNWSYHSAITFSGQFVFEFRQLVGHLTRFDYNPRIHFVFAFSHTKKFYPAAWGLKNNSPNDKLEDSVLIVVKQRHRAIVLMPLMRKNEPQGRIFGKGYCNACQFLKQSRLPILQFFGSTLDFQKHYEF